MAGLVEYIKTKDPIVRWIGLELILIPLIGGFALATFFCPGCLDRGDYGALLEQGLFSSLFWTVLANGNDLVIYQIDQRWSWLETPIKRLFISIVALLIFTAFASFAIVYFIVAIYFDSDFFDYIIKTGVWEVLDTPIIITAVLNIIFHGRSFLLAWRREAVEVERLKNENLQAKLESLKNQVNPHFLFNSLNALSSLVYANQDGAVEFIEKLSDVYRYVLDHQYDELVPIETELDLVNAYVYLNKIRFGENLKVNYIGLTDMDKDCQVPPLTLQMLLENCFKHNEISKSNNLEVDLTYENGRLIVRNNLNPLRQEKRDSNNLGLGNIKSRYQYLSNEEVVIDSRDTDFSVSVPLLKTKAS